METVLSVQELAHITINTFLIDNATYIDSNSDDDGDILETASMKLTRDYANKISFNVAPGKAKAKVNGDGAIVVPAGKKLVALVPKLTTDLWKSIQDKEWQKGIDAATKLALATPARKTTTEEVEAALAMLYANNPFKSY